MLWDKALKKGELLVTSPANPTEDSLNANIAESPFVIRTPFLCLLDAAGAFCILLSFFPVVRRVFFFLDLGRNKFGLPLKGSFLWTLRELSCFEITRCGSGAATVTGLVVASSFLFAERRRCASAHILSAFWILLNLRPVGRQSCFAEVACSEEEYAW